MGKIKPTPQNPQTTQKAYLIGCDFTDLVIQETGLCLRRVWEERELRVERVGYLLRIPVISLISDGLPKVSVQTEAGCIN